MKETRRTEVLDTLNSILLDRKIVPVTLPSFLGRVQFADGQLSGRAGKLAMADLREVGLHSRTPVDLEPQAVEALELLRKRFLDNKPRTVDLKCNEKPIVVFTDGSFVARVGGVLLEEGRQTLVFGCDVPQSLLSLWHSYNFMPLWSQETCGKSA